ncbi:hypothetical protein MMC22_007919 [Lobaria immixta]|nr:hypothetical protein [Lobaria immixta]
MSNFLKIFTKVPKELSRINNGVKIKLRDFPGPVKPVSRSFDLLTDAGVVMPKALSPQSYDGTNLPDDLILVHEIRDHYSLQAKKEMTVEELNTKITEFFSKNGRTLTKEEWLEKYPEATETE